MNSRALFAIAAFAAIASTGARADEADGSQYAIKFEGSRTRAEVIAEASRVPATRSQEPNGSRVLPAMKSSVDQGTMRAETAQAVRLGKISHGEIGPL